jgi:phosphoribosylglycinamide formyltransferase-1
LAAETRLLISNNRGAAALALAAESGVPTRFIPTLPDPQWADERLCEAMDEAGADLLVLSGYLRRLGPRTLSRYANRILNIHPGPLPAFGGQGMYGRRVHEAVMASGALKSGLAVHLVDEAYDHGAVIAQQEVRVLPGDPVETLEARVTALEPPFFVEVLRRIASGELVLPATGGTGEG